MELTVHCEFVTYIIMELTVLYVFVALWRWLYIMEVTVHYGVDCIMYLLHYGGDCIVFVTLWSWLYIMYLLYYVFVTLWRWLYIMYLLYYVFVTLWRWLYIMYLLYYVFVTLWRWLYIMYFLHSGGDEDGGETGFIGCMRNIEVGAERLDEIPQESNFGVINGTCSIHDRSVLVGKVCTFCALWNFLYFYPILIILCFCKFRI